MLNMNALKCHFPKDSEYKVASTVVKLDIYLQVTLQIHKHLFFQVD